MVISIVALIVLVLIKELNTYYRKKLPMSIPIELIVVSFYFLPSFLYIC